MRAQSIARPPSPQSLGPGLVARGSLQLGGGSETASPVYWEVLWAVSPDHQEAEEGQKKENSFAPPYSSDGGTTTGSGFAFFSMQARI